MDKRGRNGIAGAGHHVGEDGVWIELHAQRQRIHKTANQALHFHLAAASHLSSHRKIAVPAIAFEQRGQAGQHRHK